MPVPKKALPKMISVSRGSAMSETVSDEDYLVLRAKEAQKRDASEAKAWLITARTLFPRNFKIQFEAYTMHKNSNNIAEAARNLELMFCNFSNEELLWREVGTITDSLRVDVADVNSKFYEELYSKLSVEVQRSLLSTAAERIEDTIEHCKMLIMLLQKFPECSSQYGIRVVEKLLTAEKHNHPETPVNNLRKLLIEDILPLVLKSPTIIIPSKQLYRLLRISIEYCVYSVMKLYSREDSVSTSCTSTHDKSSTVDCHWVDLTVIMDLTGQKFGWELQNMFMANDYEAQWQHLSMFFSMRHNALDESSSYIFRQLFYCATILFLRAFCEYVSVVYPSQLTSPLTERACTAALVEGFRKLGTDSIEKSKSKKQRLDSEGKDETMPDIGISVHLGQVSSSLLQSFLTAVRCWDLLHITEALATDFSQLCQELSIDSWPSFQSFQIDVLIYKGLFNEAIQWLSAIHISNAPGYKEKSMLQAASCYYHLRDYVNACGKAVDVVCSMTKNLSSAPSLTGNATTLSKPARHMVFLSLNMIDVLHFCIKLLVFRLQEIVFNPSVTNDTAVGHLLVLLQYDWPLEENLFLEIIDLIKQHGNLTYNIFFNYVINIDMLEEFAHLSLPVGGNLTFNLLSSTTCHSTKQRAITRGVNKGAKEDFRAAIEKQVARCGENILSVLSQFLKNERETLFLNVHSHPQMTKT